MGKDVKISLAVGILLALFVCVFWLVRANPLKDLRTGALPRREASPREAARAEYAPPSGSGVERASRETPEPGQVYVPDRRRQTAGAPIALTPTREERMVAEVGSSEPPAMEEALPAPGRSRETLEVVETVDDGPPAVRDGDTGHAIRVVSPPVRTRPAVRTYTVVKGDSLSVISQKEYGTARQWRRIQKANPDRFRGDSTLVRIGWKLKIPQLPEAPGTPSSPSRGATIATGGTASRKVHAVQSKETLASIARHYYNDARKWRDIWNANKSKIPNPNLIRVGVELTIP